jgi:hypothetical protein
VIATIVSIMPFPVNERKPSIYPGQFNLKAARQGDVEVLHTETDYTTWIYVGDGKSIDKQVDGFAVGTAVCADLVNAMIGIDVDCKPGIFCIAGQLTAEEVKTTHAKTVAANEQMQRNWMQRLVRLADDDWKKTGQHKFISDIQRSACDYLGLERPWNVQIANEIRVRCPFCTTLISDQAIKCPQCNEIVNQKKYSAMTKVSA